MPTIIFNPALIYANFTVIAQILMTISVLLGLVLFLSALFQFKKHGETRSGGGGQNSIGGPLLMLTSGVLLLTLPAVIQVLLFSIWGDSSPMSYTPSPSPYSSMFRVVQIAVQVIGMGSLMRGIMLLARSGSSGQQSQPGTMGKAFVHIFGGILCINVVGTYTLLHYLFFGS